MNIVDMNLTHRIRVSELTDYCKRENLNTFTYAHHDQDVVADTLPIRVYGKFTKFHTSFAPATVAFEGESATVCFDNIRAITAENGPMDTKYLTFWCRCYAVPEQDVPFVMVASA